MGISETELLLLGGVVYSAQRLEFALYGIASHATHTDVAKKDGNFKDLTPEQFLRGDLAKQKATLGKLVHVFGDAFLIKTKALEELIEDRNLILHNYSRIFVSPPEGVERQTNGEEFLQDFIKRALHFTKVVKGFLFLMMEAAAKKEGRTDEVVRTEYMNDAIAVYYGHVAKHMSEKAKG